MHVHTEFEVSAGAPSTIFPGLPGTHPPTIEGTHPCGLNAPCDAAVAAATVGFAIEPHIPNELPLLMLGTSRMLLRLSAPRPRASAFGLMSLAGALPIVQTSRHFAFTRFGIASSSWRHRHHAMTRRSVIIVSRRCDVDLIGRKQRTHASTAVDDHARRLRT
jgi:hypothetical protein